MSEEEIPEGLMAILDAPVIRVAVKRAWEESQPGLTGAHEEGGFITTDPNGRLGVVRWPRGEQNSIVVPSHVGCKIGDSDIILSFHTHPNTGVDYLQEPGETDIRSVRSDPNLKGHLYLGEVVISAETIYLVTPVGQVTQIGPTREILTES